MASYRALTAALFLSLAAAVVARAQPAASPVQMLADAELTSVCFINPDLGWAVGDRGVIWHTLDGGRNWQMQRSPATCRLETVQFLDADNGWVVGGWTHPYTHQTSGLVLRTRDGGKTWQVIPDLTLPALKSARFFDVKRGWAAGDGSPLYPAGVFRTEDGGRTWIPVAKGRTLGWTTADFRDGERSERGGVLAGRGGDVAMASRTELRPSRTSNLGARYLRRLVLAGESGGWLVGDGGLVMTTSDGGYTWGAPAPLPEAARDFDFRAVAALGDHCWIAGSPGTCVFHTHDAGKTWQTYRTEQSLPLRSLTFLDENRGWAVGALGTILATRDGGRTWREQHRGGTRGALLGIFSKPSRVPLELFAQQSANEAYLGAVEIIGRLDEDQTSSRDASLPERTHEALVAAGASHADTAWRFPLRGEEVARSSQAIIDSWNQANDGNAPELLEEHLVRRIRTWRPDVIVTEDLSPRGENPLAHLTNQIVLSAAAKAADATAYSEQITQSGLEAWRVKKVFAVKDGEKQGTVNIIPSQWAPRMGRSLAETAELGRSLLIREILPAPRTIGLSLLVDHLPQQTGRRDVLSGIALLPGGEARRELSDPPAGDLDTLVKAAQKRHNVQQLISRLEENSSQGASWLGQVDDLTRGLGDHGGGEILYQLALRYHAAGKSEYAAELLNVILTKHPQHPLADAAALWLMQYYASGEAAWRQRGETRFHVQLATAELPLEEKRPARQVAFPGDPPKPPTVDPEDVRARSNGTGSTSTASPGMNTDERAGRAIALAKTVARTRLRLYADPAFRFPLATAHRRHGQPRNAEKLMTALTSSSLEDAWATCATAEQWLAHPSPAAPKKILSCLSATARPRLDGKLNDPLWQQAKGVSLLSPHKDDAQWPAVVVTAFDKEFLYIGASCRKAQEVNYAGDPQPRKHDADLSAHDRVEFHLDIDRDYSSYWTFTVDSRGFSSESCFGDATWNPTWYVASGGDDEFWTFEAAIPLAELSPKPPQVRDVWSIGIQRIVPDVGLQSFTQPATLPVRPEAFGLMVFE